MEIRLDLDRAKRSVMQANDGSSARLPRPANIDTIYQVRRNPKNPDRLIEADIPDLFSEQRKLTCLSKYKRCIYGGNEIKPKLAICICAYNEGKRMLKESLDGVYSNLKAFQAVAGINSEQIAVTVIFDGIENVRRGDFDEDLITLFDEHDYRNWPKSREGEKPLLEMLEKNNISSLDNINWSSASLYRSEEITERASNRFITRYNEYMGFRELERICLDPDHPIDINKVPLQVKAEYLKLKNATIKSQLDNATQKAMQRYR